MKIIQYALLVFFFLLPFHSLAVTYINSLFFDFQSSIPFFLSGWKEIILVFFFLNSGIWLVHHFKETQKQFDYVDVFLVLFSLVGLLIGIWKYSPEFGIMPTLLGIKYDFFFVWVLFCCKHLMFTQQFLIHIRNTLLFSGFFVCIFAYIQYFSDNNFLIQFGYFDAPSVDTIEKPASFCQLLENTNECRLQSTFAGPIRFGGFLVFLSGLVASIILQRKKENKLFLLNTESSKYPKITKIINFFVYITYIALFASFLFLLYKTYSRGAWIAEIVLIISSIIIYYKIKLKNIIYSIVFAITTLLLVFAYTKENIQTSEYFENMHNIFMREGSTGKHLKGFLQSIETVKETPSGEGLGTAGPASTIKGETHQFLNENWYAQMFTELGIAGGIIFFLFIVTILIHLKKENSEYFPLFLSLCTMAFFTHLWEESAVAYTVFAMIGIELAKYKQKN